MFALYVMGDFNSSACNAQTLATVYTVFLCRPEICYGPPQIAVNSATHATLSQVLQQIDHRLNHWGHYTLKLCLRFPWWNGFQIHFPKAALIFEVWYTAWNLYVRLFDNLLGCFTKSQVWDAHLSRCQIFWCTKHGIHKCSYSKCVSLSLCNFY